ncbi:MAG: tRNA (N(6)-L-threonylcarbamoyladenosine(37)-C(2))-methylthiotransferase MtaB [Sphaerochaetaceae bacterium]|nr:tRNA (N(6)-L-threonylcarbamoyladenosine(37)-C(2))-methylthiotransferase MtaB [Sphaerochaetaceae bacterium]
MNVCVYTLGCRLNQCESEGIADAFKSEGFSIVNDKQSAEIYIVNTCTVTSKAEQKARRMIRKFAKVGVCVVTGCYAQLNAKDIQALADGIVVVPLSKKAHLLELPKHINAALQSGMNLKSAIETFTDEDASVFDYAAASFSYHNRAYLKVQDGCDNNCYFCRVHIARGKAISLDSDIVVERALDLEKQGFSEIMLTGVNLTMYDHENDGLGGLIEKLLEALGPNIRLRLSSLEADHVDDRLLNTLKDPRMQPHFHIPVQSASDIVLKRVNRKYDKAHLTYIVERLKSIKDDPFIAADIISGLPGEGEDEYKETYEFLKEYGFTQLHVFPFSPRPNTALYKAKDKVPEYRRDERAKELRDLSNELYSKYLERQLDKECEVVLQKRKNGKFTGVTGNYIDVIVNDAPAFAAPGMLFKAKFTEITGKKPIVEIIP